jgi:hypothetical protein
MHRNMSALRSLLLGAVGAAIFVTTAATQSILGPPNEANHFIETPKGWVHPKTSWGEPDIQANLNMMQAAGIPLERCANAVGRGNCDMAKAWRTEEEVKTAIAAAAGRGDRGRDLIAQGNFGAALLAGVTDPATPQRQTTLIVDPPDGKLNEAKINSVLPKLDEMLGGGLITLEKVRVIRYQPHKERGGK